MSVALAYARSNIPSPDRDKDDFYPTPPEATRAMLAAETFTGPIWEPACGDGAICNVLTDAGYQVIATDLNTHGHGESRIDFLMEQRLLAPNIVTNPPYKNAEAFLQKSLDLGAQKVAFLLRLSWLEGIERKVMFESTPLARVHVASRRISMSRRGTDNGNGGGSMIAFAWFVWDRSHTGAPSLSWFDWKDA